MRTSDGNPSYRIIGIRLLRCGEAHTNGIESFWADFSWNVSPLQSRPATFRKWHESLIQRPSWRSGSQASNLQRAYSWRPSLSIRYAIMEPMKEFRIGRYSIEIIWKSYEISIQTLLTWPLTRFNKGKDFQRRRTHCRRSRFQDRWSWERDVHDRPTRRRSSATYGSFRDGRVYVSCRFGCSPCTEC